MSIRTMLLKANHEIEIRKPTTKRSPLGGVAPGGTSLPLVRIKPVWVQPANSDVVRKYEARSLKVTHRIFLDMAPLAADVDDYVLFKGRSMKIRGIVNELEMDRLWYIDAEEGAK